MRTHIWTAVAATALALAGCGGGHEDRKTPGAHGAPPTLPPLGSTDTALPPGAVPDSLPAPGTVQEDGALEVALRLRAVNTGPVERLRLRLAGLQVKTAAGDALAAPLEDTTVDLGGEHAPLLARITLPAGVDALEVVLTLADAGHLVRGGSAADLDTALAPLRFTLTRAGLVQRGHAVLHLDVQRSLAHAASVAMLLPCLSVQY